MAEGQLSGVDGCLTVNPIPHVHDKEIVSSPLFLMYTSAKLQMLLQRTKQGPQLSELAQYVQQI